MGESATNVALPAYLKKRLQAYKVVDGDDTSYLVKNRATDEAFKLEPWQFFVLEVLPGCNNYPQLLNVIEDRFGGKATQEQVESVFSYVADHSMFGMSALSHPLLADFNKKRRSQKESGATVSPISQQSEPKPAAGPSTVNVTDLPPGVADVVGLDRNIKTKGFALFNPKKLVDFLSGFVAPIAHIKYVIPILFVIAAQTLWSNADIVADDLTILHSDWTMVGHAILSMFTVNLAVVLVHLFVSHKFRGNIQSLGVVFYMGFFPRFVGNVTHGAQFSKKERIWLHLSPLLCRMLLFSVGVLLWHTSRGSQSFMTEYYLFISLAAALSLLITANPLVKSNGYYLVTIFLEEPNLRTKAYNALLNRIKGASYQEGKNTYLIAYAVASFTFMLILVALVFLLLSRFMKVQFGGVGVVIAVAILGYFIYNTANKFKRINKMHERASQFKKWRDRTLVVDDKASAQPEEIAEQRLSLKSFFKRSLIFAAALLLFLPYRYEPGGHFVLTPAERQELSLEHAGIVSEVFVQGGEYLPKGTVLAQVRFDDVKAQVDSYSALLEEQEATVAELRSRPRPEELALAESALRVAGTRLQFSRDKLARIQTLHDKGSISTDELESAKREYEVDSAQLEQEQSNFELVKAGAPAEQIAAAEAKVTLYQGQKEYYTSLVQETTIQMPFDGHVVGSQLTQKKGSFLERGAAFAVAERSDKVLAKIDISEADIGYVSEGAEVVVRPNTHSQRSKTGVVLSIEPHVNSDRFGNYVSVITQIDNSDGTFKTGMTGYAKIQSEKLPVWQVFTKTIYRFFYVEVWSWLP